MDIVFFVRRLDADAAPASFDSLNAGYNVLAFFEPSDHDGIAECYRLFRNECKECSLHVCRLDPDESGYFVMSSEQRMFARIKYRSYIRAHNRRIQDKIELDYFIKTGKLL